MDLFQYPKISPLEYACLMGCCIPTGWGSVTNSVDVKPGDKVVLYGTGGVGLNLLRACVLRQADPVIVVDIGENKGDLAMEFSATHFICNKDDDPVPKIKEITGEGADVVFEAIGVPGALVQTFWSVGMNGKIVIPGITPHNRTTKLPLQTLPFNQKSILILLYTGINFTIKIVFRKNLQPRLFQT